MFWFLGRRACGILAPQPGIEHAPLALAGKVLTTGPPGMSPIFSSLNRGNHGTYLPPKISVEIK